MSEKKYNYKLFLFCWLAYTTSYICRKNFSSCLSEIVADFAITKTYAGAISTGFLACYGAGQLINGILGDRFSPKGMIFTGLLGAGVCNVLMGINTNSSLLIIIWCLNGYFNSMLWSPIIKIFAEWMNGNAAKKAALNISTSIPVGMVLSYLISSLCLQYISWRSNFYLVGIFVIIVAFICFIGIGSLKDEIRVFSLTANKTETVEIYENKSVQSSPGLIKLIISAGLIYTIIGIFFNGVLKDGMLEWIPTYLIESYGISPSFASLSSIIFSLVNLSGAYIAAFFNNRLKNNELTTTALMFVLSFSALLILKIFNGKSLVVGIIAISVSIAVMYGANTMLLSFVPLRFSRIGKSSTVTGFLDAVSYIASAISTVIMGALAENKGWDSLIIMWIFMAVGGTVISIIGIRTWKIKRNLYAEAENV